MRGTSTVKRVPRSFVSDEHHAAVRLDRAMRDGEAEAAAAGFRRSERLEQPVLNLRRDSGSFVDDLHRDRAVWKGHAARQLLAMWRWQRRGARARSGRLACTALSARLNTARWSRSSSPSTMSEPAETATSSVDLLSARGVRAGERGRAAHDSGDIDRFAARDAHAREIEKLGQQARQTIRFAHDEVAECLFIVCRDGARGQLLHRASDRRERILDLVRERCRKLGDRLEPLRAKIQLFETLLVGDVLEDRRRAWTYRTTIALGGGRRDAEGKRAIDAATSPSARIAFELSRTA